jgi:two-component system NtrC family response regulator
LQRHLWPGNVRELANIIEAAFTFKSSDSIGLKDLPEAISERLQTPLPSSSKAGPAFNLAETEREVITRALESTKGNKYRAAEFLGISRKMLYARIAKYGLAPPRQSKRRERG